MRWPFRRHVLPTDAPAIAEEVPQAPARETRPEAWRELAPLRTLEPVELTADGRRFSQGLGVRHPAELALKPLGHDLSLEAPQGLVSGLAHVVQAPDRGLELPLVPPPRREEPPAPVARPRRPVQAAPAAPPPPVASGAPPVAPAELRRCVYQCARAEAEPEPITPAPPVEQPAAVEPPPARQLAAVPLPAAAPVVMRAPELPLRPSPGSGRTARRAGCSCADCEHPRPRPAERGSDRALAAAAARAGERGWRRADARTDRRAGRARRSRVLTSRSRRSAAASSRPSTRRPRWCLQSCRRAQPTPVDLPDAPLPVLRRPGLGPPISKLPDADIVRPPVAQSRVDAGSACRAALGRHSARSTSPVRPIQRALPSEPARGPGRPARRSSSLRSRRRRRPRRHRSFRRPSRFLRAASRSRRRSSGPRRSARATSRRRWRRVPVVRADDGERGPELPVQPIARSLAADVTPTGPAPRSSRRGGASPGARPVGALRPARGRRDARPAGRPDRVRAAAARDRA